VTFAVVLLCIPVAATLAARSRHAAALPIYGTVPAFSLTDQTGRPVSGHDLDGRVWVADFIYTGCSEVCPRLTGEVARLQTFLRNRGLLGRAVIVSISVDPERDTPERLRAYAAGFAADPATWKFLTGPAKDVEDVVVRGFREGVERSGEGESFSILHGSHLVLIDGAGRIRGYYDAQAGESMAKLRGDLARLVEAAGNT
jgi:protein SCO1/2